MYVFEQPHEDGPLYFPVVGNLTMGSHSVLNLYKPMRDKELGTSESLSDDEQKVINNPNF